MGQNFLREKQNEPLGTPQKDTTRRMKKNTEKEKRGRISRKGGGRRVQEKDGGAKKNEEEKGEKKEGRGRGKEGET